jgi:hypothetical protein
LPQTAFNAGNAPMKADNFEEAVKQYQIAAEKRSRRSPSPESNLGPPTVARYRRNSPFSVDSHNSQMI